MKLVLASKSPRRSEILKNAGIDFTIRVADADETIPEGTKPQDAVVFLAAKKSMAVERADDEVILGADTVVVLDDKILGKPKDREDAFNMLKSLSGRVHSVFTGVCAIGNGFSMTFSEETKVEFLPLTDDEINSYIDTNEPYDKAGAYGIQGLASKFIRGIQGDYFNVVGLPISRIYEKIITKL
ncbi:MAG: septum formation inhibitor Maf [Clostridia bacterium]|nr:septum formation inhibitor Maf [Clostridia bacterium]